MAPTHFMNIQIAGSNESRFGGALLGDVLYYPEDSNQRLLFGTDLGAAPALTVTASNVVVAGDVVPAVNEAYDLGAAGARWRDLYLSGNTIDLGGVRISNTSNNVAIRDSNMALRKLVVDEIVIGDVEPLVLKKNVGGGLEIGTGAGLSYASMGLDAGQVSTGTLSADRLPAALNDFSVGTVTASTVNASNVVTSSVLVATLSGSNVNASNATVKTLVATALTGSNVNASNVVAGTLVGSNVNASNATVTALVATTLTGSNVNASNATVANLTTTVLTGSNVNASNVATSGVTRINAAGGLVNVTADASVLTSGLLAVARGGTGTASAVGTGSTVLNSNAVFAGTLTASNINFTGALTQNGIPFVSGGGSSSGSGSVAGLSNNGSNVYVLPGSNLGIGTSNPQALLHVAGDTRIDGNIALSQRVNLSGVLLRPRATAGQPQNITSTVSSVPGFSNQSNNVTLSLSAGQSNFRFVNSNGSQVASLSEGGVLNATTLQQNGTGVALSGHVHSAADITSGTLLVARGGTGTTTSTGTGSVVLSASPTFTGTVSAATVNATTLQQGGVGVSVTGHQHSAADITSGILPLARGGTGIGTATGTTGTGNIVLSAAPTFTGTILANNISINRPFQVRYTLSGTASFNGSDVGFHMLALSTIAVDSNATFLNGYNISNISNMPVSGVIQIPTNGIYAISFNARFQFVNITNAITVLMYNGYGNVNSASPVNRIINQSVTANGEEFSGSFVGYFGQGFAILPVLVSKTGGAVQNILGISFMLSLIQSIN